MAYYTFENEDNLPELPVPLLSSTTSQLLQALKPLLSSDEYCEMADEAMQFIAHPVINLVQSHLIAASQNPTQKCYLNSINHDTNPGIYGELRGDTLPRNPYLVLEEDPYSKALHPPNQQERAANLINSSLKFIVSLRNETLKPDVTPKNGNPLTMKCYRNLFGTSRIPGPGRISHSHVTIQKFAHYNDSRHIIVICNNQFYKLEVLTEFNEKEYEENKSKHAIWFSDHELSLILQSIIESASHVDQVAANRNSVGCITTQTFKTWKAARLELANSNAENLKAIDDALFMVILDPSSPVTDQEKTVVISHGTSDLVPGTNIQRGSCTSRWYDKLQLIVTKNAVTGVVWESSSMDSTAILRFISDIYTDSVLKLAKDINGSEYTLFDTNIKFISAKIKKPEAVLLKFNKTPELESFIHISETRLADLISQHDYHTFSLNLDTHFIKKFGLSIDSLLQIAFQITNYSLYGRMANSLEPITTRKFKESRTELIPIQNENVANLVKLYITTANPEEKWEWFKKCCDIHSKQYHDAMIGKGFERHLMALTQVVKRLEAREYLNKLNTHVDPIPELESMKNLDIPLLSNPLLEKISNPELLISNCGNPALHLFGIPPAIDQGYGIGYIIHTDKVLITMCSKFRQAERFLNTFKRVIDDLKGLLKHRSNFIININDSTGRKLELQKLRIENELNHVIKDNVTLRHPIKLTVDKDFQATEDGESHKKESTKTKDLGPHVTFAPGRARSLSIESTGSSNDYDLLGGYDYFDIGELDIRSNEISRNESYMNSTTNSHLNSNLHSRIHSRRGSSSNLLPVGDFKQKLSINDIKDRFSPTYDEKNSSNSALVDEQIMAKKKSEVGRPLDMSSYE